MFDDSDEYRIKPRTIRIGKYDVPEPERNALEEGEIYFTLDLDAPNLPGVYAWTGTSLDASRVAKGIIHLSRKAAELHAEALLSLTGGNR